ncbi:MAG TPA: YbhB/YbcL family Raf kinase inhibitor-like protein [Xanthobacteraceae bacterium]|nr:YbhB/YbcL family Raf kinase inhibitor-like protein [Xanthobacteraceae bacterium]
MKVRSQAFSEGAEIPRRYTCDGENTSPPIEWAAPPAETRSFALLCNDPDAPMGTWHHWAVYDIPPRLNALPEGAGRENGAADFKQGTNDFGHVGYGGPCPPHRHGTHHYRFRLLALSIEHLQFHKQPSCKDIEHEARKHTLAEATLVGVYQR